MVKETSAFSIIILLFGILMFFWFISLFQTPAPTPKQREESTTFDESYIAQNPFIILHKKAAGIEYYSGSVVIPLCDSLQSELAIANASSSELLINLTIVRQSVCEDPHSMAMVPFSAMFTSSEESTTSPVIEYLRINKKPTLFTVTESH